jgi:hypothetical protein
MLGRLPSRSDAADSRRHRTGGRLVAAAVAALAVSFVGPSVVLACTTALPARQVAEYRAAAPVLFGTVEEVSQVDITVRVEVVYRGTVGSRLRLSIGPVDDWCAFPFGAPAIGDHVLVAVADPRWWAWPNSGIWTVDGQGRILSPPEAPWSGAPAPTTVAEALRTMGIAPIPNTAMASVASPGRGAWPATPMDLAPWLVGLAWMVGWLRRRGSSPSFGEPNGGCVDPAVARSGVS